MSMSIWISTVCFPFCFVASLFFVRPYTIVFTLFQQIYFGPHVTFVYVTLRSLGFLSDFTEIRFMLLLFMFWSGVLRFLYIYKYSLPHICIYNRLFNFYTKNNKYVLNLHSAYFRFVIIRMGR